MKERLEQYDTEMHEWFASPINRDYDETKTLTSVPIRIVDLTGLAVREYHPVHS